MYRPVGFGSGASQVAVITYLAGWSSRFVTAPGAAGGLRLRRRMANANAQRRYDQGHERVLQHFRP